MPLDYDGFKEKLLRRTNSVATVRIYMASLKKFERFCRERLAEKSLEETIADLKNDKMDVYEVLDKFAGWVIAQKRDDETKVKPRVVLRALEGTKKFLRYYGVEIQNEKLREKLTLPIPQDIPDVLLSKDSLRKLLTSDAPFVWRLGIGIMMASGSRIGETLQLRVSDFYLDEDPVRVHFREETVKATKQGRIGRDSFLTSEIAEMVKTYIAQKGLTGDDQLFPKSYDPNGFREVGYGRLLPDGTRDGWLWKLGFAKKLKGHPYYEVHPHALRKFFRTWASRAIDEPTAEALIGHGHGLVKTYNLKPLEFRQEDYRKVIPKIVVIQSTDEEAEKRKQFVQTARLMGVSEADALALLAKRNLFVPDEAVFEELKGLIAQAMGLRRPDSRLFGAGVF